jgi:tRNA dimethylallyltransferase
VRSASSPPPELGHGEVSTGPPPAGGPSVVALFGPTGVGKTAVALALAGRLREHGEDPVAVSADALQVYAGLQTLTGAASAEERARLEHRLVGTVPVTETFSVGAYMPLAHAEVDAALAAGRRPIVVGGTGLYLRAALTELDLRPPPAPGLRESVEHAAEVRGLIDLHAELARRAPGVAATVRATDRSRLLRALELLEAGEDPAPTAPAGESELWSARTRRPTLLVGLVAGRETLIARIDARVDAMVAAGVEAEVRRAVAAGASATARKAVGFEELLAGDVEAMKRRTRRYAKRQLTWMRKLAGVSLVEMTDRTPEEAAGEVVALLRAG